MCVYIYIVVINLTNIYNTFAMCFVLFLFSCGIGRMTSSTDDLDDESVQGKLNFENFSLISTE